MAIKELMYRIGNPRKARDVFFRAIFGEDKEALLQLYNALNGTDYDNPDELEIVTIKGAIFITMKNDVAYMLAGVLNLYEHQSTVNPNMPVRFLVYLGQEYQKIIEKSSKSIYGTSIVQLPTPKCVVFYNGDKEIEDDQIIKLSDAYINKDVIPDAELTVRVININYGHNKELMDKCEKLMEYSKFMEILRENKKRYGIKRAIKESIEYCLDNNILTDFLREHRAEVPGFLLTNFDKRKYERTIREEGFEDGRQEGRQEGQVKILKDMVNYGVITADVAAKLLNITEEEFEKKYKDYNPDK